MMTENVSKINSPELAKKELMRRQQVLLELRKKTERLEKVRFVC